MPLDGVDSVDQVDRLDGGWAVSPLFTWSTSSTLSKARAL